MRYISNFIFFLFLLIVEGASLMSVELLGAKYLAPFYGSSLFVWTSVLAITVLGLTFGYYFGGKLSENKPNEKKLVIIISIASLIVLVLPLTSHLIITLTSGLNLKSGVCIASLLLLVPPTFCFGLVGPMVVRLMADKIEKLGNIAGTVYFTSTLGGISATFLFGFYLIPEAGLQFSSFATAIALAVIPVIYFVKMRLFPAGKHVNTPDIPIVQPYKAKPVAKPEKAGTKTQKIKNTVYLFAVIEGATVMAVEIISARMLAPWFGSSLYVWAAVIGITLFSLALGYYSGGILADKFPQFNTILWVLLLASIFLLLMHYFSSTFTMALSSVDLRIAVVLAGLALILPPLLFLGMIPTLLIRFVTNKIDNAGRSTGMVFTISSASGILSLLLFGFFIIPEYGLTVPSIFIGILVGIVPFFRLIFQKKYISLIFLAIVPVSFSLRARTVSSSNIDIKYYSEGLLGQVLVADINKNEGGKPASERVLFVNRMGQTNINMLTNNSNWSYIIFASAVASKLPENSNALVLGLGGGSMAGMLHNNLKLKVDAVELDERIAEVARRYFFLSPEINVIVDDARHYLETTKKSYDLIFFDLFKGEVQPPHVLSLECFKKAKSLLNPGGIIIINFNGFLNGDAGKSGRSVLATLEAAGLETRLLPTPGSENERNTLFISSIKPVDFSTMRYPLQHKGVLVNIDSLFLNVNTLDCHDAIIFTDDKPALDRLNINATNMWRKGYNTTYTSFFTEQGIPLFK